MSSSAAASSPPPNAVSERVQSQTIPASSNDGSVRRPPGTPVSGPGQEIEKPQEIPGPSRAASQSEVGGGQVRKRPAPAALEGEKTKKAKVVEEDVKTGDGVGSVNVAALSAAARKKAIVDDPDMTWEEKFYAIRDRGNWFLDLKIKRIGELKEDLAQAQKNIARVEVERDDWMAEAKDLSVKEDLKAGNSKSTASNDKIWRKSTTDAIRQELKADHDRKLDEKTTAINKRHKSQMEAKQSKLDAALQELQKLKAEHNNQVKKLKEELREANKNGGATAREKFKTAKAELKDLQNKLDALEEACKEQQRLAHSAGINARAQSDQRTAAESAYATQRVEMQKLEKDLAASQHQRDTSRADLRAFQAQHRREMRQLEEKWQVQARNSEESQYRVVANQRAISMLNAANRRLLREIEELKQNLRAGQDVALPPPPPPGVLDIDKDLDLDPDADFVSRELQ